MIISSSWDNTVKVWDYKNNLNAFKTLYGHSSEVWQICLDAD